MGDMENGSAEEVVGAPEAPQPEDARPTVELPYAEEPVATAAEPPIVEQSPAEVAEQDEPAGEVLEQPAPASLESAQALTPAETGALLPAPVAEGEAPAEAAAAPIAEGEPVAVAEPALADTAADAPPAVAEPVAEGEPAPAAETPVADGQTGEIAAIAQSLDEGESLDDIQPVVEPAPAAAAEIEPLEETRTGVVWWWPFLAYLGVWAVLVGVAVWQFTQVPAGHPLFETRVYSYTILGGLGMIAVGLLLIPVVWLVYALRSGASHRGRAFADAFVKGAIVTFGGVVMWWIALVAIDYARLGRF